MNKHLCFPFHNSRTGQASTPPFSQTWPSRLLATLIVLLLLSGCAFTTHFGSGNVVSETRDVRDFDQVDVCCGMQLILTQGNDIQLRLEADDNLLPEIETFVRNGQLTVRFRTNWGIFRLRWSQPVTVYLQMPTIHGVTISGGGSLTTETVEADRIAFEFSGGSRGTLKNVQAQTVELVNSGGSQATIETLDVDTFTVDLSGGSRVTLNGGTATDQQITASGGSHYEAAALAGVTATLDVSGGSEAKVWVTEALNVQASGGSQIEYTGNPTLDQQLSGGSQLRAVKR